MTRDISVVKQMSSRNRLVWMPTGEHTNHLAQIHSPLLGRHCEHIGDWLIVHRGSLPTERSSELLASQTVCHKPVYHPFPKLRQESSSNYSVGIYTHLSVSSLAGCPLLGFNSGQNYSPQVLWDQRNHVGWEVQLLPLKASPCSLKELFTELTSAWWDHLSFYSQHRSCSNGEQGGTAAKFNRSSGSSIHCCLGSLCKHPLLFYCQLRRLHYESHSIWCFPWRSFFWSHLVL